MNRIHCRDCGQYILPKDRRTHAHTAHGVPIAGCGYCGLTYWTAAAALAHHRRRHPAIYRARYQQQIVRVLLRGRRRPERPAPPIEAPRPLPPIAEPSSPPVPCSQCRAEVPGGLAGLTAHMLEDHDRRPWAGRWLPSATVAELEADSDDVIRHERPQAHYQAPPPPPPLRPLPQLDRRTAPNPLSSATNMYDDQETRPAFWDVQAPEPIPPLHMRGLDPDSARARERLREEARRERLDRLRGFTAGSALARARRQRNG